MRWDAGMVGSSYRRVRCDAPDWTSITSRADKGGAHDLDRWNSAMAEQRHAPERKALHELIDKILAHDIGKLMDRNIWVR
jgi:hypothetical protein